MTSVVPQTVRVIIEETGINVRVPASAATITTVGIQGPRGPQGVPGGFAEEIPFAYGDATPKTLLLAQAGRLICQVLLIVETPFNGIGASLRVGDADALSRLMSVTENDPSDAECYATSPAHAYDVDTDILLSIDPGEGATQGSGRILITIQP